MSFEDEESVKLVAPADFYGPTRQRHCTDTLCGVMIFLMWAAMSVIGISACTNGDYRIVLYPLDYDGNICGTDYAANMTEYPYLLYVNSYTGGVCVNKCPSLRGQVENNVTDVRTLVTYGGVWQTQGAELPADFIQVANYSESKDARFCSLDSCFPNNDTQQSWNSQGVNEGFGYAYYVGDTFPLLWRCYLTSEAEDAIQLEVQSNTTMIQQQPGYDFFNNLFADMWMARFYIFGFGFGVAVGISFVYTILLRLPLLLTFVIWSSVFISIAMFMLAGYYAVTQANTWDNQEPQVHDDTTISATRIAGYCLFATGALLALIMCCLRKQIQLALTCVKETSKDIHRMPLILLIPVLQAAGFVAFMIIFMIYAVHLASLGELEVLEFTTNFNTGTEVAVRTFEFDTYVYRCAWYFLFCFFWTSSFIVASGDLMVALCFAKAYFEKDKSKVGSRTVLASIYATLRYHLGTCAFGSLILAVINLVRAIVAKIQNTLKKYNNHCIDLMLCCCQCCLCCFEKCMKFLNKNAYVQTAIFGTSFCKSSRQAFYLVVRNAARVAAISSVSSAVLFVGKLFISTVTTGLAYYAMTEQISEKLFSVGGPTFVVFLISYFVSDFFMDIYDMGTTTILHCFIADEGMFDGDERYATDQLQSWVDKNAGEE